MAKKLETEWNILPDDGTRCASSKAYFRQQSAKKAKEMDLPLITFSGFSSNNELRKIGDINLWVDSSKYNVVEIVHQTWILSIIDYLIDQKT